MQVADVMQTDVVTITPETTLPAALRLARESGVRHLPVVDHDRLVGIVSDRDLKRALPSPATALAANELTFLLEKVSVAEIMTRSVIVVGPRVPVEEAARRMVDEKISALPVVSGGALVGILTETDVTRLFVRALGAGEPSSRIDVRLGVGRSALAEIIQVVEAAGGPVVSVVTLTSGGEREAVIRVASIDARAAIAALRSRGYRVKDLPAR